MKRVSNNLLQVGGEESLQLLEICIIVICILIEFKSKREIITDCISIITCILNMRSKLVSNVLLDVKNKKKEAIGNFRFGFHEVNSAVGKHDVETALEILQTLCCICFIQIEQYANCVACLEVYENTDGKFQSIHHYMKGMYIQIVE
jgi:hypothetical protein